MKTLRWRTIVVLGTVLFSAYLLIPTYLKFGLNKQVPKVTKADDPWYYSVLPSEVLKLGLDLRGGVHLVLGIDYAEVEADELLRTRREIENIAKNEKLTGVTATTADKDILVKFNSEEQADTLSTKMDEYMTPGALDFISQTSNSMTLRLSPMRIDQIRTRAREQALETIRNRIDEFGLAEPIIQPHGEEKILVQFPGVGREEVARIKSIIERTAKLSFQLVITGPEQPGGFDGSVTQEELEKLVDDYAKEKKLVLTDKQPITKHLDDLNVWMAAKKKLPAESELIFNKVTDLNTREESYVPYILAKDYIIAGDQLDDAYQGYDPQTNDPIVNFNLNAAGTAKFADATGANVGRMMAIVLDRNVKSAPRIKSRIPGGRAYIEMGRAPGQNPQEVLTEAKDIALTLRSGALPARLEFLEERTIGPSLGADAIKAGTISLGIGLLIVLVFMTIYYRFAGVLAVIALVLNGLFVLGAMAAFEGTLTLPGLAGLTLTLGMAVDANVLIFEHIREELRAGKSVSMAISEGYRRAFTAILDSNLTTILAALVLMSFGYGPIRGFAVTLLIGLVVSMYTAVFVTRLIIDYAVVSKGKATLSI